MLGKALSTVRGAICTSTAGLANPASCQQFCTLTSPGEINEIPQRRLARWLWPAVAQVGVFDLFF